MPDRDVPPLRPPIFSEIDPHGLGVRRPWDARLARWMVAPLAHTWVGPNYLTTLRLLVGLAAVAAFFVGTYLWSNVAALLLVVSNFLDHADGELARLSGKSSRFGHIYDMVSDALVTILLFFAIGAGIGFSRGMPSVFPGIGAIVGISVSLIFYVRVRIEDMAGKAATRQASFAGFETEDVLYLMPLVTLSSGLAPMLWLALTCAPLYALWTVFEYRRVVRRLRASTNHGR
jgi:phosphatidylglycerophosphate synthase